MKLLMGLFLSLYCLRFNSQLVRSMVVSGVCVGGSQWANSIVKSGVLILGLGWCSLQLGFECKSPFGSKR